MITPSPSLLVLIGAAGAGKSTWARTHFAAHQVLCLDQLRLVVSDDESDQNATPAAVAILNLAAQARLCRKLTTVVDATNTTVAARRVLVGIARSYRVPAVAVMFSTPLEVCLTRNSTRPATPRPGHRWARRVPEDVVRHQYAHAAAARALLADEGFTAIRCVDADGVLR